ncbi:MAG: hypothetical protein NTY09_09310 [bacterium]|nr:hypothetical protein [bacterium]
METLTSSGLKRITRMMSGSSFDKDIAEDELKDHDPATLPEDILEIWISGSTYDKFRAGRVKQAWADRNK